MKPSTPRICTGLALSAALLSALACFPGVGRNPGREPLTLPAGTSWPTTLEGVLELAVEEGTPYEDGLSEINFCSLERDDGYYLLEVYAPAVRGAGMSRDDLVASPRVRATLSGPSELLFSDETPYYVVTALEQVAGGGG